MSKKPKKWDERNSLMYIMSENYNTLRFTSFSYKRAYPYFERTEEVRNAAVEVLRDTDGLLIQQLHKKLSRFRIPTTKHLSNLLCKDPRKRFKAENKMWHTL